MSARIHGLALPRHAVGVYSTVVWGMIWLVAIEGMVFLSLVTSWYYLRFHNERWPPPGVELPDVLAPGIRTVVLVGAAVATALAARAVMERAPPGPIERQAPTDPPSARLLAGLFGGALLAAGYLGHQVYDLLTTSHSWRLHVYTSLYWTLSVYASLHVVTLLGLQLTVGAFAWAQRLGPDRAVAVQATAIYGIFVALSAVLSWLTLNVAPYFV